MKYPCLITTDIHLVDSPAAEYRWELFPWINQKVKEFGVKSIRLLGDLTDAKDNHPASLVNRIVSSIQALHTDDLMILSGNHDWLLKGNEFFRFLNHLPNVDFITRPTEDQALGYQDHIIMLPFTKTPAKDWENIDWGHYDYAFMHQTISGARASNGQIMDGEGVPPMPVRKRVYSGDIHVPQTIGNCTYIGSPYHVHFGDDFSPRVLILDKGGRETWIQMPSPRRIVLRASGLQELKRAELDEGDQVKLRMVLSAAEKHSWSRIKREATAILEGKGVVVHGVELEVDKEDQGLEITSRRDREALSPEQLVRRFVEREELGGAAYDSALDAMEFKNER